jgi:tripartite-type tricarboxylate transporter receptor subunit TctC
LKTIKLNSIQTRRKALTELCMGTAQILWGLMPLSAVAQSDRIVKFILPNATGSGIDGIVRAAAPALSKALGASVVIENQSGASGIIGLQSLAKSSLMATPYLLCQTML